MQTDVTRFLDSKKIDYTVKLHKSLALTCQEAARQRNVRLSQIVKCMVGKDVNGRFHVMLLPGDKTLKIKKVRTLAGHIRIDLVPPDDIAKEKGVIVGAISPIQFMDEATFYMDQTIFNEQWVDISSGDPGAGVELSSSELSKLLNAKVCDIISDRK